MDDTIKLNVYADNWFLLFVNGRLVAVDPIPFTPHNVVRVDFLPEYPMTIAVLAKDNADPNTGMEYGTNIGDGGFILKFGDGTVANAKEFTVEEVDPKPPYSESDFEGAKFIWTEDLTLDNTIIFRTRIEKPDWKPRWNTKSDLEVKGAPLR